MERDILFTHIDPDEIINPLLEGKVVSIELNQKGFTFLAGLIDKEEGRTLRIAVLSNEGLSETVRAGLLSPEVTGLRQLIVDG